MDGERIEGMELVFEHEEHEKFAYGIYKNIYGEKNVISLNHIETPYIIDLPTQIKKAFPDFYIKSGGGFYIEVKDRADDKYTNQSFDAIQFGVLKSFVVSDSWRKKILSIWRSCDRSAWDVSKIFYDVINVNDKIIQRYNLHELIPSHVFVGNRWNEDEIKAWRNLFEIFRFCFLADGLGSIQTNTGSDEPFFLIGKKEIMEEWKNVPLVSIQMIIIEMLRSGKITFQTKEKIRETVGRLVNISEGDVDRAKEVTKDYIEKRKK